MRGISTEFVATPAEYEPIRQHLKERACPWCRAVGCLIRHGFLRGYGAAAAERVQRGWRVFCSNRGRKQGCGRTFAILLARHLYRRLVGAERLWQFLTRILASGSVSAAWAVAAPPFGMDAGYKLWAAFRRRQSALRIRLHTLARPVASGHAPAWDTIAHLRAAFPQAECPVSAFQLRFQQPFLAA